MGDAWGGTNPPRVIPAYRAPPRRNLRRVGDFGRDPVDALRQPVSFCFITQVDTAYQLDTALRRYDDTGSLQCE